MILSKQVDKAVLFHDQLKRLKLKTLASDDVIKKDNIKRISLLIYYVKLHMLHPLLISALILKFLSESLKLVSNLYSIHPALQMLYLL